MNLKIILYITLNCLLCVTYWRWSVYSHSPSTTRSWNNFHHSAPLTILAFCLISLPWYPWQRYPCGCTMTACTRCLHSGCRAWRLNRRGSHTAAKWQSSFSKLHFWEGFHLHWHLGQNRMTFELWLYVGCGSHINISDGLDGILPELTGTNHTH